MNFAEGIKRVYVTLACLVLIVMSIDLYNQRPTTEASALATSFVLEKTYDQQGRETKYVLDFEGKSRVQYTEDTCKNFFSQFDPEKHKEACNRYNFEKSELPKELAYHAAQSVGILALVAIGSIFFWMLMAWIGRGFIAKKTSAGSE